MATLQPIRPTEIDIGTLANRIQGAIPSLKASEEKRKRAQELLERHGASAESAVAKLADLMYNAKNEHVQLKANERILQIHEIIDEEESGVAGGIQFILGNEVNVQQILIPERG